MIRVNGDERAVQAMTIEQLIAALEIVPRGIAVALNGELVRRSEWPSTLVSDNDQVEIVTAVAGG